MARTIGKNTVLPDIPYSPSLPALPQVSLVNDTLPARNAMGQGFDTSRSTTQCTCSQYARFRRSTYYCYGYDRYG